MPSADYVIVGAGSAGCVLANRLSEDPRVSVILLEAGKKDRSPNIRIPAAFAKQFRTKLDWDYNSEPEPHCDGRSLYLPRGKGLGGSSSMNAMLYVRGRPLDYDLWEQQGATGWGWDGVREYFLKSEDNERGASEYHATGGPLNVADVRTPMGLTERFMAAAEASGIPRIADYNGPEQDGVSQAQVTQRNGRRWSTASAYLKPAIKRPNLTVITGAQVLKIELTGSRATGVRFRNARGTETVADASTEVILSAGSYGSPQLLMLSGIGPAANLKDVGVPLLHDLPGVGQNLQDHPYFTTVFESKVGESLADAEHPKYLVEWLFKGTGPLASNVAEALAFVRSRPGLPAPDIQFHFAPAFFVEHGFQEYKDHALTIAPALVSPKSRGEVWLNSSDPLDKIRVLTNTLAEDDDVASMVAGVKLARQIAHNGPLAEATGAELRPGAEYDSDDAIEASIRREVELLYHPVGTCRMGAADDDGAVLDPELRVRGIEGLRVADASVMPLIPGGNTNAPVIMIAERAADVIRGRIAAPVG